MTSVNAFVTLLEAFSIFLCVHTHTYTHRHTDRHEGIALPPLHMHAQGNKCSLRRDVVVSLH